MSIGIFELVAILAAVLLLFGPGRLPKVMGDLGKGVRALRESLKEEETPAVPKSQPITSQPAASEPPVDTPKP